MKYNTKNPIEIPEKLSDCVMRMRMRMRGKLAKHGLMIVNYLPEQRLKTRYGTPFKVHKWALVEMVNKEVA